MKIATEIPWQDRRFTIPVERMTALPPTVLAQALMTIDATARPA
jgi:hypothetical protein